MIKDAIDLNNNNTIQEFNKKMTKPLIYEKICRCHIHNTKASPLPITPPPNTPHNTPSHCIKF
jgi:hypothetical protein